jgi:hypothetical protein
MTIYLCSVSNRFPEIYSLGLAAKTWGVEERYRHRIAPVLPQDKLVFVLGGVFKTLHTIESSLFEDHTPIWLEKDGSQFPCRIKISDPVAHSEKPVKELADQISFMKGKVWGGTIQGASGVFNNRLTESDLSVIFGPAKPGIPAPVKPQPKKPEPSMTFYEKDAEGAVEKLLPQMGYKAFVDPVSGKKGRQYICPVGRIDLLCIDEKTDDFVVLELKRGKAPEQALLQLLRYMSWVRTNLAKDNRDVRGVILAEGSDAALAAVVAEVPKVAVRHYKFAIELDPDKEDS